MPQGFLWNRARLELKLKPMVKRLILSTVIWVVSGENRKNT